jgi:hypothetical protein
LIERCFHKGHFLNGLPPYLPVKPNSTLCDCVTLSKNDPEGKQTLDVTLKSEGEERRERRNKKGYEKAICLDRTDFFRVDTVIHIPRPRFSTREVMPRK